MSKRILPVVLVLCIIMAMAPAAFATGEVEPAWDGVTREDIPFVNGRYEISTGAQLARLSDNVNSGTSYNGQTIVIVNDIDLGGHSLIPIGTRDEGFGGILTGQQKEDGTYTSIKNAEINYGNSIENVGVIGFVDGGTVQNLYFDNIDVVSTANVSSSTFSDYESSTGVAVGTLNSGSLVNLTVLDNCSVSGVLRTGGIVGDANGNSSSINGCTNNGTVNGSANYTGGIVGATHNIDSYSTTRGTTVTNCVNTGTVSGTSEVGGIIGYADRAYVFDCDNSGSVTGTDNYGTGGIVGCDIHNQYNYYIFKLHTLNGSTIEECTNSGTITAPRDGGILGSYVVAPGDECPTSDATSTITACTNSGNIVGPEAKCGVIAGMQISYAQGDSPSLFEYMKMIISNCTNTGTLNGESVEILSPGVIG